MLKPFLKSSHVFRSAAFLITGLFWVNSCSWTPQVKTPLYEGTEGSVSLITESDTGFHPNHPADLPLTTIQQVLRGLYIQRNTGLLQGIFSNQPSTLPVFSEENLVWLAPALQRALTQVTNEEKVRFQVKVSPSERPIKGRMYLEGKNLVISIKRNTKSLRPSSKQNPGSGSGLPAGVYSERLGFSPEHVVEKEGSRSWLSADRNSTRVVIDYGLLSSQPSVPVRSSNSERPETQPVRSETSTVAPLSDNAKAPNDPTLSNPSATSPQPSGQDLLQEIRELKRQIDEQQAEIEALKERN